MRFVQKRRNNSWRVCGVSRKRLFINLWVTMRCNFRCRYCYVKPLYANQDLSLETADALIAFVKKSVSPGQEIVINFHGGEPLLQFERIKYIVRRIREELPDHPSVFGMTTNGSLLDEESIAFIGEYMKYNCSISIDGDQETMQCNRFCCDNTPDCYRKIEQNAEKLLAVNPHTRIRMTYDRLNVPKLFENIRYFIDKGFRTIVPVADYYTDTWITEDFAEVKRQYAMVRSYIREKGITGVNIDAISCEFAKLGKCTAGNDYYSIDVFGKIYPCTVLVGDDDWIIGDLVHGIDSEQIRRIEAVNETELTGCRECGMYDYCAAVRCRFINYATTGSCISPNLVTCQMMNVKVSLCESAETI